jgi:hypothetical protein
MEQMTKIEALEFLVKNEIHTSEWKGTAMYLKCRMIITSTKTFFTKNELDEMLKEVENS